MKKTILFVHTGNITATTYFAISNGAGSWSIHAKTAGAATPEPGYFAIIKKEEDITAKIISERGAGALKSITEEEV